MAKKKKLTGGNGWELISSRNTAPAENMHSLPPGEQRLRVSVEKRAKGKIVTVISGLVLTKDDTKALARELKDACGAGGSAQGESIEIQGDHTERVRSWLGTHGWGFK